MSSVNIQELHLYWSMTGNIADWVPARNEQVQREVGIQNESRERK